MLIGEILKLSQTAYKSILKGDTYTKKHGNISTISMLFYR